jgi:transposase
VVIFVAAGRMLTMPRAFPREFRDDVVTIARRRETSFEQIAKDFGISATTVQNWVSKAEVEDRVRPGVTSAEHAENRELKKRVRLLEQENEVLRRAAAYEYVNPSRTHQGNLCGTHFGCFGVSEAI